MLKKNYFEQHHTGHRGLNMILISWLFLVAGYTFNRGIYFHPLQLILIFVGFSLLLLTYFKREQLSIFLKFSFEDLLLTTWLITIGLFFLFDTGVFIVNLPAAKALVGLKFIALLFSLLYFFKRKMSGNLILSRITSHLVKYKFGYLVCLAVVMRLWVMYYSPHPQIDVFWVLDGAAEALTDGRNPYAETWTFFNYYGQDYQIHDAVEHTSVAYMPLTIVAVSFFKIIFGDVRSLFVFSSLLIAGVIYYLIKNKFSYSNATAELVALLFLYSPWSLFILEQSWIDVFGLLFLSLFLLLMVSGKRKLAFVVFGLMLLVKQTMFVFTFFILRLKGFNLKNFLQIIAPPLLLITPFLIWAPRDFIDDVFYHHLIYFRDPVWAISVGNIFNFDALGMIFPAVMVTVLGLMAGLLWYKNTRNLLDFMYASVIMLLAIFMLRKGFLNYYHLISSSIILILVLELGRIRNKLPKY